MKIQEKQFDPFVSIIIPVYNGANFVAEAITSALEQTYANVEVIVVNDGSTDDTEKIVSKFKEKVRYVKKANGGVASALNEGIKQSTGEYISWLSHDDIYYAYKIAKQVDILATLPASDREKTILYSNYVGINSKGEEIGRANYSDHFPANKLNSPYFPIVNALIHGCSLLVPRRCFIETGFFDPKLKYTQDYALWFEMFPKYKVRFHPDFTIKSRTHESQGTRNITPQAEEEYDRLWIHMADSLDSKQKTFISGSTLGFYQDILKLAYRANYLGVVRYMESKINDIHLHSRKSFVDRVKSFALKIMSLLPYYHRLLYIEEKLIQNKTQIDHVGRKIREISDKITSSEENLALELDEINTKIKKNKY